MTGQDGTGVEMVDIKSVVSEQTLSSEQTLTSGLDVPANPRPRRPVVSGWSVQSGDSSTWGISQEWPLPQARYSEVDSQGSQPGTPFDSRSPTPTFVWPSAAETLVEVPESANRGRSTRATSPSRVTTASPR